MPLPETAMHRLAPAFARSLIPASLVFVVVPLWAETATSCQARSGNQVTPVIELYTSEGCNSCPPADRWLSKLKPDAGAVALAFHVDYWDRLGWKDRFASAQYTERQALQQRSNGARFSYTPQVVVDGADRKDWSDLGAPPATRNAAATVTLTLARDGPRFAATVVPSSAGPARLAAYWAVTEHGHVTPVKAGENQGVTLRHDHVVREYQPVAAWSADPAAPVSLTFSPSGVADPAHPRQVNLVVLDAATGRPVQALKLGC
jgi:hypothetical protein